MKSEPVTYPSAVDHWIAILVLFAILGPIVLGIYWNDLVTIFIPLGIATLLALICYPTRYILTDDRLIIQCGLFGRKEIAFERIKNLTLSSNPLAAPAWSLRRIEVEYEGNLWGFTLISPKDRQAFIDELNRRKQEIG